MIFNRKGGLKEIKNKKNLLWFAAVLLMIGGIALAIYLKSVGDYKRAVAEISFSEVSPSQVADGVYIGECDVDFIYAKVSVVVENGTIRDISILEHKNGRGVSAETIVDTMLEAQSVDVDAVSGATNSSIVLKKAVENALKKGLSQ